jgi:hypothetical protein
MNKRPPADPADHAEDSSHRYAEALDIVAGQAMTDLGIPDDQMGARDPDRNRELHRFFPSEGTGGSVSPAGQITLDSGLMNPDVLAVGYDEDTRKKWQRTKRGRGAGDHRTRTGRARARRRPRTGDHRRPGDEIADRLRREGMAQADGEMLEGALTPSRTSQAASDSRQAFSGPRATV